jgi:hypothetical protein
MNRARMREEERTDKRNEVMGNSPRNRKRISKMHAVIGSVGVEEAVVVVYTCEH